MKSITIKELHAKTGVIVRGASKTPVQITDRGEPIAIISASGKAGKEVFARLRELRSRLHVSRGETLKDLINEGRRL
ncbi:MAG: hypothetical protein JWM35_2447 [Verrucomicrobia bacterium]|nr:hypothetical protein [Verrucomicrobiota bacterium]